MKDGIKLKGKLATYMRWPFILTILLVAMDVLLYSVSWKAGGIGTVFTAVYLLLGILLYFHRRPVLLNELISFATQYGQVQKSLMKNFALPYALLDAEGKILWMNDEFLYLTGKDQKYRRFIGNIFPEVTMNKLPLPEEVRDFEVAYQDHDFRLNMRRVEIDELLDGSQIIDADKEKNYLIAAYLFDETELKKYMRKNQEEQKQQNAENEATNKLISTVVDACEVEIPEIMIKNETDDMIQDYANRLQQQGISLQQFFQITGQSEETLREQMAKDAESKVKLRLVLDAVATQENLEVGEEDVDTEYGLIASQYNMEKDKVKELIPVSSISYDVRLRKALDLIKDSTNK